MFSIIREMLQKHYFHWKWSLFLLLLNVNNAHCLVDCSRKYESCLTVMQTQERKHLLHLEKAFHFQLWCQGANCVGVLGVGKAFLSSSLLYRSQKLNNYRATCLLFIKLILIKPLTNKMCFIFCACMIWKQPEL